MKLGIVCKNAILQNPEAGTSSCQVPRMRIHSRHRPGPEAAVLRDHVSRIKIFGDLLMKV